MTSHSDIPHDKLLDMLLDVVCVVDVEGRFLSVSAASEHVFGFRPDEMIGRTSFEMMHPDDRDFTRAIVASINSGQPSYDHENRYIHKHGHIVHIMWSTQWFEAEQIRVGVARDITPRKQAEAMQTAMHQISEAAHSAEDLQILYAQVHAVIQQLLPADNLFVALHDTASDQLSFPYHADQFGAPPPCMSSASYTLSTEIIRSGEALLLTSETVEQTLAVRSTVTDKHVLGWLGVPLVMGTDTIGALVLKNYCDAVRYTDKDKELLQFASGQLATAIERKRIYSRLEFLAQYDQLTELPNQALFLDRLQSSLKKARRGSLQLAVLYLDMDNFKQINDTFGHTTGNHLLREVAKRLSQCVRESDTIGRLGGDEFAILLDNISTLKDATGVADKVLAALSEPYILDSKTVLSAPSLGIAVYPEHSQDELQLVQLADEAMYAAKRSGGRRYSIAANPAIDS